MSSLPISSRDRERRRPSSPAQIASLLIGIWWTINGIGALLLDANLATGDIHGGGDLLGAAITVNGWHAAFHLVPGLIGIAASRRPGPALSYALAAGGLYIFVGVWGLLAGGDSVGLIAVDTSGSVVHVIEGLVPFTAGILTLCGWPRTVAPAPRGGSGPLDPADDPGRPGGLDRVDGTDLV